jgi:mono/diheme cytochrome c family protein
MLSAVAAVTLGVQAPAPRTAGSQAETGARLFRTYCATCHGAAGRGDGPMVGQLRTAPPDLTRFAMRNGGVFPSERVRQIIDGRGVGAHGIREMPVWGDAFRSDPEGLSPAAAQARIDAIVRYLQTIQERTADGTRPGAGSAKG